MEHFSTQRGTVPACAQVCEHLTLKTACFFLTKRIEQHALVIDANSLEAQFVSTTRSHYDRRH